MAGQSAITGLDATLERMRQLSLNMQKKHARKAARKAMKIVENAAKANAKAIDDPATRAAIQKNIAMRAGRTKSGADYIVMRVGVQGGAGTNKDSKEIVQKERKKKGQAAQQLTENQVALPGGDTRHFRYVELGTATTPATPFLRNALADNVDAVTDSFCETLKADILGELNS